MLLTLSDSLSSRLGNPLEERERRSGCNGRDTQHNHDHKHSQCPSAQVISTRLSDKPIEHHHDHFKHHHNRQQQRRPPPVMVPHNVDYSRDMILKRCTLLMILLAVVGSNMTNCLDSPVKIQRNKMMQQQQLQLQGNATLVAGPHSQNNVGQIQDAQSQNYYHSSSNNMEATTNSSNNRIDRVRRTNTSEQKLARHTSQQPECPSQRLIQGLLPPEYVGSPASSQRPATARAHCECNSDSFGWHLTCFVGGGGSGGGISAPASVAGGGGGGSSRPLSGVSSVAQSASPPVMPNQLHPAFRTPQVARQQQQQQQVGANLRPRRALNHWLDETPDELANSNSSSSSVDEQVSPHEGFGEDPSVAGGHVHHHQQAAGAQQPSSSTRRPTAPLVSPKQNSRANPNRQQQQQPVADSIEKQQQQQDDRLMPAASNVVQNHHHHHQHLTFQTIPILFSVRYLRNNMIEIDCDQAVPNYKAAMFRGFNVNEIHSFTFNDCQLPNIPLSVLLHRTRSNDQSGQQQQAGPQAASGSSGRQQQTQSLRPNRRPQQATSGLSRRRRQLDEPPRAQQDTSESRQQPARAASAQTGAQEPKVKSLIINLNAIVDQRTLISLLTGLDLLEELQLNYMQLNLTSFLNNLDHLSPTTTTLSTASTSTGTTPAMTSGTTSTTSTTASPQVISPATSTTAVAAGEELSLAASANINKELQADRHTAAAAAPTPTMGVSTASATPTMNLAPTSQQQATTLSKPAPATTTTTQAVVGTTGSGPITITTQASSTTTSTTTTTTPLPPTMTTTNNNFQNSLKPFKQREKQQKPITTTTSILSSSSSTSSSSSATTRPSIALMGAPRGLIVAQATGLPPTSTSSSPTTTPLSVTVPGIDLRTVHASGLTSSSSSSSLPTTTTSTASDPTTTTTTRQTTSTMPGQRQQQQQQATTANNSNLISVGVSQSHSVSYTANGPGQSHHQGHQAQTSRPQSGMFHSASGSSTPQSQPPASTTFMSSQPPVVGTTTTINSNSQQQQQLSPNRLHQSPSPWFAGGGATPTATSGNPPAAGSRLSMSSSVSSGGEPSTAPPTSWSAMTSTPPSGSLGAPANTPPFSPASISQGQPQTTATSASQNGGASFGYRTPGGGGGGSGSGSSSSSLRTQTTLQQQQQTRRLPATTTSNNFANFQEQPTIAAGGRLSNPAAGLANFNTRRFPATLNQMPTTSTPGGRFVSPFSSAATHTNNAHDHHWLRDGDSDFSSAAAAVNSPPDDSDDLASMDSATTPNLERIPRQKRAATPLEELELSFGELLPSLRTLKLESFIDLSPLATSGQQQQQRTGSQQPLANSVRQQQTARRLRPSGVGLMRSRRQSGAGGEFSPADMPERDRDEESSGAEQNSVVAPPASGSSGRVSAQPVNDPADAPHSHDEMDIEPGETMWRLASERRPSSSSSVAAHSEDSANTNDNNDDDDESPEAGPLSVVPAPASFGRGGVSATPTDSSSDPTAETTDPLGSGDSSSLSAQVIDRQRQQVSQTILTKLFSRLSRLQVLQLTSNEIPFWPDAVLQDSRQSLLRLYLISNNIRQLGARAFAGLAELRTLDLSSNQLRQLPGDSFRDLINLRQVRACRNLFRKLPLKLIMRQQPNETLQGHQNQRALAKLDSVDFSKNKYLAQFYLETQQVAAGSIMPLNLAPIASLNLSDCALTDQLLVVSAPNSNNPTNFSVINQLLFAGLPELTSISLQNNKFRDLLNAANLFGKNKQLTRVDLSKNQLDRINGHLFNANASQLSELKLAHNKLTELPEQLLFNLRKLRHLSLSHNKLVQLNSKLFLTNQLLESLDLSHNQLVGLNTHASGQIPFGNGANLRHLNLAFNNLSAFEPDLFDIAWSFYTQLQSLDLSHNHFAGQIQVPIFYTIADEMLLNLASNRIQSVSVDALVQHEQVLDKYATSFETVLTSSSQVDAGSDPRLNHAEDQPTGGRSQKPKRSTQFGGARVPTVTIRLANNPLACDCMLEPLVSYTRRVAAATNPALVASLFQQHGGGGGGGGSTTTPPAGANHQEEEAAGGLAPGSKYSFSSTDIAPRQPQVLYQFKFNELYCDQPRNLRRRPLNHISIGDLLCPVQDEHLCPRQCDCHYQSAFKTIIVDCSGRQLSQVPEQLADASNFNQFELETSFNLSQGGSNKMTITHVDKMIIRLDNNRLASMEPLGHLFQVMSVPADHHARLARSLQSGEPKAKKVSPVAMARLQQQHQEQQQRQTRQASMGAQPSIASEDTPTTYLDSPNGNNNNNLLDQPEVEMLHNLDPGAGEPGQPMTHMSTAVLESAEEFRNKRYSQKTCELYLDHNSIDELPETFLATLDQVRASSLQASQTPPQAALPTAMLEPPIHSRVTHLNAGGGSGSEGSAGSSHSSSSGGDPMRASASVEDPILGASLFGRQPLAAEKKAALMETVQHNVRMSKMQHQQQPDDNKQVKVTMTPSLVVLSLRYNNLGKINARMLSRLSKLIRASNTKLFLGHNPFNCSENFEPTLDGAANATSSLSGKPNEEVEETVKSFPVSPMGDQLLAVSDSVSGAYLEHSPDDLLPAASGDENNSLDSTQGGGGGGGNRLSDDTGSGSSGQLQPANCPVGQLKTWLTRHHSHVGDLDELYCVHMPAELAARLKLTSNQTETTPDNTGERLRARHVSNLLAPSATTTGSGKRDHDHPWTSSLMAPTLAGGGGDAPAAAGFVVANTSQVSKNGHTWNADLLMQSARLLDVDLYDLCPYSNIQVLDSASLGYLSAGHQQALISVAVLFILLSLCLLLMLIYFGDTQTILAFVYIHLNPIYNCLHLNESHLDGEKLYDAFVSYSSADRDIVMQLIEHLEQPGAGQFDGQKLLADGKGTNLDKSRDTLVTEADLRPDLLPAAGAAIASYNTSSSNGTLQRRTNSALSINQNGSYQDLSTMSRSTSRMMLSEDTNGHQMELMSSPRGNSNGSRQHAHGPATQTAPPYRLCIHERDWLPGHLISWNIVNSVQNSRRTILILSKEFIKSVWFQVEFHTAYYQMLEDKIDRLIVIVRGELPPKHELDKNLAFLLTTKTYLTWGEKWFWERLHYALPHRAGVPPAVYNKQPPPPVKINNPAAAAAAPAARQYNQPAGKFANGSAVGLLSSLAAGHADPARPKQLQQQQQLVMSNIGSNLLLTGNSTTTAGNHGSASSSSSSSSSGSNGGHNQQAQATGARSTSASSFLSGSSSSTNQLFRPNEFANNHNEPMMMTTSNDLLSSPMMDASNQQRGLTRLSINGGGGGMRSSSPLATDSGRITADRLSSSQMSTGGSVATANNNNTTSGGITSIMLGDGNAGANSRLRAKKQEKLQSFVEKEISNRLNLSEL